MGGKYKVVSLFSGAGGLDLGFVLTSKYEVVLANEILRPPAETYGLNFGMKVVPVKSAPAGAPAVALGDVGELDFAQLEGEEIDVVVGGPPCQDFSIVRGPGSKRRGIEVRRGRLYAHFVRALIHLQPKAFVFENVPGLVTANRGLAYRTILEDLRNLNVRWEEVRKVIKTNNNKHEMQGYEIAFSDIIDMTKLGLPQKRERLIIIGIRQDLARKLGAGSFWSEFRELKAEITRKIKGGDSLFSKYPLTPLEVFEGDVLTNLQEEYRDIMKEYKGIWEEVNTRKAWEWKRKVWDKLTFDAVEDYLRLNKVMPRDGKELGEALEKHREILKEMGYYGKSVKRLRLPDGSNTVPRESPRVIERMKQIPPGENHEFVRGTRWEVKGLMSNIYRRVHPLIPAPTVMAYGGGGTWGYHYERGRGMLTNRERARLQSFPDTFLFKGTQPQVRAQIGEAVPPIVAKRIAEAVATALSRISN